MIYRPDYYLGRVVLFMSLISLSSLSSFTIELGEPARLELLFAILFSAITFQFVINDSIPNVPYFTLLDKYISASLAFILLIGLYHAFGMSMFDSLAYISIIRFIQFKCCIVHV